jgi:Glycosyl hydrolases family 16
MAAPAGYTPQQLIFDDRFTGTSLDPSNWNTYLGAQGIDWNDHGNLPVPYSGPNAPITSEAAMFGPSQVSVDNGLTLTAVPNTNQYAGTFPWISGVVTTEGKFTLPTTGWYVQVRAKMPDVTQGMWPAIWFLPPTAGTPFNEFDGYEGGWLLGNPGGTNPNEVMHSDYFSNEGQKQMAYSVDTDLSAGYDVFGYQYIPGQSVTAYLNGRQVWQVSASSGVTITAEPYEIIIELQVTTDQVVGRTVATNTTPSASMYVAEVQAYSYP